MQFFSIGIARQNCQHKDQLLRRLKYNIPAGFEIIENDQKDISYINLSSEDKYDIHELVDIKDMLSHGIGSAFAQFLLYDIKKELIDDIIEREYFYFDDDERVDILQKSIEDRVDYDDRKWAAYIHGRFTEFFDENRQLSLEGFVRFRLKEYLDELEYMVGRSVDELLIDKEYNEFIRLLQYFVEIQEPKIEEVHVLLEDDEKYTLLDGGYRVINNDMLEDVAREISDNEISDDDLLISSLITIAPNKIVIHDSYKIKNTELLTTIKNVFCGKVEMKN